MLRKKHNFKSIKEYSKSIVEQKALAKDHNLEVYRDLFDDIIRQNSDYGFLLSKIKYYYDLFISQSLASDSKPEQASQNTQGDDKPEQEVLDLKNEIQQKDKVIHELERDNAELIAEYETYKEEQKTLIQNMKKQLRSSSIRENKYMKLLDIMKDKGYQIERPVKPISEKRRSCKLIKHSLFKKSFTEHSSINK